MGKLDKKIIAILLEEQYQELEVWYPYYRLKEEGAEVYLVAPESDGSYPSKHGYPATPDKQIGDTSPDELDGVVIPGGYAPDHLRRYPAMVDLVRSVDSNEGLVAAICHGGWLLASANILEGRRATSFYAIKDDMVNAGAQFVDEEVVVDNNIITSRKPDDLPAFCGEIINFFDQ